MLERSGVCADLQPTGGLKETKTESHTFFVYLCTAKCGWPNRARTRDYILNECMQTEAKHGTLPVQASIANTHSVDLPQHRSLPKEHWLAGVHKDQVKVGLPGPVGCTWL